MQSRDVCCVVGAQFGSEGKGALVARIAQEYAHHVRVGAANAGHTLFVPSLANEIGMTHGGEDTGDYDKKVMQQVPCAAYAHPAAKLYIGPGAQISPEILYRELADLDAWREERGLHAKLVSVDPRAHVITGTQIAEEAASDLEARIGSTSATAREGIGQAQADRIMRADRCLTAEEFFSQKNREANYGVVLADVPNLLSTADGGILLEGTQGTGLSITTGFFPFCTSRNTTAAGLCADSGVAPARVGRVIGVARSHPIRVAGNSGPFYPDSLEEQWSDLGIDPESERTTVTKKVRRVAQMSISQLQDAAILNGVTEWALMFADYIEPGIAGKDCNRPKDAQNLATYYPGVIDMMSDIYTATGVPVSFIGTGPRTTMRRVDEDGIDEA